MTGCGSPAAAVMSLPAGPVLSNLVIAVTSLGRGKDDHRVVESLETLGEICCVLVAADGNVDDHRSVRLLGCHLASEDVEQVVGTLSRPRTDVLPVTCPVCPSRAITDRSSASSIQSQQRRAGRDGDARCHATPAHRLLKHHPSDQGGGDRAGLTEGCHRREVTMGLGKED